MSTQISLFTFTLLSIELRTFQKKKINYTEYYYMISWTKKLLQNKIHCIPKQYNHASVVADVVGVIGFQNAIDACRNAHRLRAAYPNLIKSYQPIFPVSFLK